MNQQRANKVKEEIEGREKERKRQWSDGVWNMTAITLIMPLGTSTIPILYHPAGMFLLFTTTTIITTATAHNPVKEK